MFQILFFDTMETFYTTRLIKAKQHLCTGQQYRKKAMGNKNINNVAKKINNRAHTYIFQLSNLHF